MSAVTDPTAPRRANLFRIAEQLGRTTIIPASDAPRFGLRDWMCQCPTTGPGFVSPGHFRPAARLRCRVCGDWQPH